MNVDIRTKTLLNHRVCHDVPETVLTWNHACGFLASLTPKPTHNPT